MRPTLYEKSAQARARQAAGTLGFIENWAVNVVDFDQAIALAQELGGKYDNAPLVVGPLTAAKLAALGAPKLGMAAHFIAKDDVEEIT